MMGISISGRGGRRQRTSLRPTNLLTMPRAELDAILEQYGVIDREVERRRWESKFTDPEPEFEIGFAFPLTFQQLPDPIQVQVAGRRLECNPIWGKSWSYQMRAAGLPEGYRSTSYWLSAGQIQKIVSPPVPDARSNPCANC